MVSTAQLRDFIGEAEARGNYNAYYGNTGSTAPLDGKTIQQIYEFQDLLKPSGSTAVGRYQIKQSTLKSLVKELGIKKTEVFTPELQDKLADALLERRGLSKFQSGELTAQQFSNRLAREWAALPLVTGKQAGKSYYAGVGPNKSQVSVDDFLSVVQTASGRPVPPGSVPRVASETDVRSAYAPTPMAGRPAALSAIDQFFSSTNPLYKPLPAPAPLRPKNVNPVGYGADWNNLQGMVAGAWDSNIPTARSETRADPVGYGADWNNLQGMLAGAWGSNLPTAGGKANTNENMWFTSKPPPGQYPKTSPLNNPSNGSTAPSSGLVTRKVQTYSVDMNGNPIFTKPSTTVPQTTLGKPSAGLAQKLGGWVNGETGTRYYDPNTARFYPVTTPKYVPKEKDQSRAPVTVSVLNPDYEAWETNYGRNNPVKARPLVTAQNEKMWLRNGTGSWARGGNAPLAAPPPAPPKYITKTVPAPAPAAGLSGGPSYSAPKPPPPVTFQGTATGNTYTAGQSYTNSRGQTVVAQPDGSFVNPSTGRVSAGSSQGKPEGTTASGTPLTSVPASQRWAAAYM